VVLSRTEAVKALGVPRGSCGRFQGAEERQLGRLFALCANYKATAVDAVVLLLSGKLMGRTGHCEDDLTSARMWPYEFVGTDNVPP